MLAAARGMTDTRAALGAALTLLAVPATAAAQKPAADASDRLAAVPQIALPLSVPAAQPCAGAHRRSGARARRVASAAGGTRRAPPPTCAASPGTARSPARRHPARARTCRAAATSPTSVPAVPRSRAAPGRPTSAAATSGRRSPTAAARSPRPPRTGARMAQQRAAPGDPAVPAQPRGDDPDLRPPAHELRRSRRDLRPRRRLVPLRFPAEPADREQQPDRGPEGEHEQRDGVVRHALAVHDRARQAVDEALGGSTSATSRSTAGAFCSS